MGDQYSDYRAEMKTYYYAAHGFMPGDPEKLKTEVLFPARDKFLNFITKFLKNNASNGYLIGDKISWVDVLIAEHMADMSRTVPGFLDQFPESKLLAVKPIFRMVHYRLKYFDGRGLAEIIRQIFAVAGQDFEDVRYSFEEFPKHKAELPFGQMPVLEFDGKQLAQSSAIARYLARQFGLAGKNAFEEALVDSIADQLKDYFRELRPFYRALHGFDKGDLDALFRDLFMPTHRNFFTLMTKFLVNNKSGYLVGDSLTWADLWVADIATWTKKYPSLYDGFPEMKAHAEKIRSIPAVQKWLEENKFFRMVKYRLEYFDGRGRAEIIRQIFAVAGQSFDDVRYSFEEFAKHKADLPFGQLPVLEVDGKQLAQSCAIARYLARQFGLAGKNAFDEAVVDSIVDQFKDYFSEIRPFFMVLHGFEKGDLDAAYRDVFLPSNKAFFTLMTRILMNTKSGFLVGDSLTWADLLVAEIATWAKKYPSLYDGFPEMKAHAEKIRSIPAVKKWLAIRPDTYF
ncbi:unnamed protein product [Haemonchus placei]|uniref:glutathione transferase n=1 Tax=Haemonchus placei TaxID=6290 RepID=A0A3P7XS60_HAEPC|nr:unnamed protein product [Haemonchus placei]